MDHAGEGAPAGVEKVTRAAERGQGDDVASLRWGLACLLMDIADWIAPAGPAKTHWRRLLHDWNDTWLPAPRDEQKGARIDK